MGITDGRCWISFGNNRWRIFACLTAVLVFTGGELWAQQTADTMFFNGKILTVDDEFSIAQAVAVSGNTIAAVGTDQQVQALAGPNTTQIDLKGRTMIPGLVDTHRHMYSYAERAYGGLLTPDERRRYPLDCGASPPRKMS